MHSNAQAAGGSTRPTPRRNRWPARLDWLQSASGLVLALFMWGHMFFVSSILLGKDAMWTVTKFFEGYFFFGRAFPWMVSMVVAIIFALVVLHALLVKEVPATREVLASLPNVFSALCLNTRGLEAFVACKPFERLFKVKLNIFKFLK